MQSPVQDAISHWLYSEVIVLFHVLKIKNLEQQVLIAKKCQDIKGEDLKYVLLQER